jgi:hypothetical protein
MKASLAAIEPATSPAHDQVVKQRQLFLGTCVDFARRRTRIFVADIGPPDRLGPGAPVGRVGLLAALRPGR